MSPTAAIIEKIIQDTSSDDIVINANTNKKNNGEDVVRISSKTLWTVIVANCYDTDLELDGSISIRRVSGFLDDRLHPFSIISVGELVSGIFFILFYLLTVFQTVPKLTLQHKVVFGMGIMYTADGLFNVITFYTWNAHDTPPMWSVWGSALSRSVLISGIFYLMALGLQHPQEIPWKYFAAAAVPMLFAAYVDNMGIINFSNRQSGTWLFGYSHIPSIELIIVLLGSIALTIYAQIFKPSETSHNEKHNTLLAAFAALLAGTAVVVFSLFVWRFNKTLIQTRKSEWVPYTITPIYYFLVMVVDAWFWLEFNPSGWQTLDSMAHEPFVRFEQPPENPLNGQFSPVFSFTPTSVDPFTNEPEEARNAI